ncbi:radical SAM protein [Bacillota bacterium]
MRYEGRVYRPPSEADSLILQVTIGCAHNQCTFCGMYKGEQFRIRPFEEVVEDLKWARTHYRHIEKVFLADGDALVLKNETILKLMDIIKELFPECKKISIYGSPQDVLRKTKDELKELRDKGLDMIYIGGESGSDKVLKDIKKGVTADQLVEAVCKIEAAGIKASVTFISGIGGRDGLREHAAETGKVISRMSPSYVGLLTLMVEPGTELCEDISAGRFTLLTAEEVLDETYLLIKNINLNKKCVFRSNHASNYISLKGDLPADKDAMLGQIERARNNKGMLKDERFRQL